jgi:hypothetical protein
MRALGFVTLVALFLVGCGGPSVPSGIAGYEIVVGETAVDATVMKQLRVDCPEGKRALGAGWSVLDSTSAILDGTATYFEPAYDGSHWLVNARNNSAFSPEWKLRVRVVCAIVAE